VSHVEVAGKVRGTFARRALAPCGFKRSPWWISVALAPVALWAVMHTGIVWGVDAVSYWAPDPIGRYAIAAQGLEGAGAFRYAPPLALPVLAFGLLPYPTFVIVWTATLVAVLAWLVGPRWLVPALAAPFVAAELALGNIHLLMAGAVLFPPLWIVAILAKVTPAVCLTWFVARREWRPLAMIGGAIAILALVSAVVLPGSWEAWWTMLRASAGADALYLPVRLVGAAGLAWYAGTTSRRWVLPTALLMSLPHLGWSSLVVLAAIPATVYRSSNRSESIATAASEPSVWMSMPTEPTVKPGL
jgi:hypothetical protein